MNNDDHTLSLPASDLEGTSDDRASGTAMISTLLERVPCELCGEARSRTLFTAKETRSWWVAKCNDDPRLDRDYEFPIVECVQCRHVFVNPRMNADVNSEIYARYWRDAGPEASAGSAGSEYADHICRQLSAVGRVGSLLDFGCGWGTQLMAAARGGWRAQGLEVDARKVDFCREHGLDAVLGDLRDRPFPDGSFDAAVAEQVFEHLYSPVEYMRALHRVLKPGGVLYVAVPNLGSLEARLTRQRWNMVHPVSHVRYFDRGGLAGLMSRCGFEVLPPSYRRRFDGAPIKNGLHAVKTFMERSLRWYPLGLALMGRKA